MNLRIRRIIISFWSCLKNEKFVYWVNEVNADFGGIVKASDGKINPALQAMEYKRKVRFGKIEGHEVLVSGVLQNIKIYFWHIL